MPAPDVARLSLAEASELLRTRKLSPVELAEACLARIENLEPKVNAFITVTAEEALSGARKAEDEIAAGRYRGPLQGVPVAVKDLFDTSGTRTTYGAKIRGEHVAKADSAAVQRLREAGAVLLGKLNLHEFAF